MISNNILANINTNLATGRFWLTKDLAVVRKENRLLRAIKALFNRIAALFHAKSRLYKEIEGKAVLAQLKIRLSTEVNPQTLQLFCTTFDALTHQKYALELQDLARSHQERLRRALHLLRRLTRTVEEATPLTPAARAEILAAWEVYAKDLPLAPIDFSNAQSIKEIHKLIPKDHRARYRVGLLKQLWAEEEIRTQYYREIKEIAIVLQGKAEKHKIDDLGLQTLANDIAALERQAQRTVPFAPTDLSGLDASFPATFGELFEPNPPAVGGKRAPQEVVQARLEKIDFTRPLAQIEKQFVAWVAVLDKLYTDKAFVHLEAAILYVMRDFSEPRFYNAFLGKLGKEWRQRELWAGRIQHVQTLLSHAHLAQHRPCLPHAHIPVLLGMVHLIYSLTYCAFRMGQETEEEWPTKFVALDSFKMEGVKGVLYTEKTLLHKFLQGVQDVYLDLGIHGPLTSQLFDRIYSLAFYTHPDAAPLLHQTTGYLGLLLAPANNLFLSSIWHVGPTIDGYRTEQERVRQKLAAFDGSPLMLTPRGTNIRTGELNSISVTALGLELCGSHVWTSGRPDMFYAQKDTQPSFSYEAISSYVRQRPPIRSEELRYRVVESTVISPQHRMDVPVLFTQDGWESGDGEIVSLEFLSYGMNSPESMIRREVLPSNLFNFGNPNIWRELELTQTAGTDRLENTLLFFARYPEIFQFQGMDRLLSLALFQRGRLYQKLQRHPEYAESLLFHLEKILNDTQAFLLLSPIPILAQVAHIIRQNPAFQNQPSAFNKIAAFDALASEGIAQSIGFFSQCEAQLIRREKLAPEIFSKWRNHLFALSCMPLDKEEALLTFFKQYLLLAAHAYPDYEEDIWQSVQRTVDQHLLTLGAILRKHPEKVAALVSLRLHKVSPGHVQSLDTQGILWRIGSHILNLQTGQIVRDTETARPLPKEAKEVLAPLLPPEELRREFLFTEHLVEGRVWLQTEYTKTPHFKLFIDPAGEKEPILLLEKDQRWHQREALPEGLPRALRSLLCLRAGNDVSFWTPDGKSRKYVGRVEGARVVALEQTFLPDAPKRVFLSAPDSFAGTPFAQLESSEELLLLGGNQLERVLYPTLGLEYHYKNGEWITPNYPGWRLVARPLQQALDCSYVATLFTQEFRDYHLLAGPSGKYKLLLAAKPYTLAAKHARKLIPSAATHLYALDIDPEKGLQGTPQALLYLAYVLALQGKYAQGLLMLHRAFQRVQKSADIERELAYFESWKPRDPNAVAFKLHLAFHLQQQLQLEPFHEKQNTHLKELIDSYAQYRKEALDIELQLPEAMCARLEQWKPRSLEWILERYEALKRADSPVAQLPRLITLAGQEDLPPIPGLPNLEAPRRAFQDYTQAKLSLEELEKAIPPMIRTIAKIPSPTECDAILQRECHLSLREFVLLFREDEPSLSQETRDACLRLAMDREIAARIRALPPVRKRPDTAVVTTQGTPLFPEAVRAALRPATPERVVEAHPLEALRKIFIEQEMLYEAELVEGALKDKAPSGATENQLDEAKLSDVRRELESFRAMAQRRADQYRASIVAHFQAIPMSLLRMLKEQDPLMEEQFQKGLWSFGEGEDQGSLNNLYKSYLAARTGARQAEKALRQIEATLAPEADQAVERAKLVALLQQERHYDVDTDPHAPMLLLLENELDILCSSLQIRHFLEMVAHPGSFKHEAWGGGKTTVLRHLISKIHADGAMLSGLLTHAPLLHQHHTQLKESTAAIYGQRALCSEFSRQSATDGISLRQELLKLLLLIEEKGRLDQTLAAFISLRHAYNLKILSFTSEEGASSTFDEIRVFGRLLDLLEERLLATSDELDALCNPGRYYQYATGEADHLDVDLYNVAFHLVRILDHFKKSPQSLAALSEKESKALFKEIANELFKRFREQRLAVPPEALDYWLSTQAGDAFLQECTPYVRKLVKIGRVYLSTILPLSFTKRCGVDYGRAADGILTRPYSDSNVCIESSLHGSHPLLIWYSCLDYWQNGVTTATVERYIQAACSKRGDARKEIEKYFLDNFKKSLASIQPEDYPALRDAINSKTALKLKCLRIVNFETLELYSRRLAGNAKQAAHAMHQLGGTSGNSEGIHTLPLKVRRIPELMHQAGTTGRIYRNMAQDFEGLKESEVLFEELPLRELVKRAKPGEAFVDVAPRFAGLSAEAVVEKLHKADMRMPIRYLNARGEVRLRAVSGQDFLFEETQISIGECFTLYMHKDRRGVDLPLAANRTHWMTLTGRTTLTDVSQGGMRVRPWGRGAKFRYLLDQTVATAIEERPYLKSLPLQDQLYGLFCSNEATSKKALLTTSNRDEILAIGDAFVQRRLRRCETPEELARFKEAALRCGYIEQAAGFDVEKASQPRCTLSAHAALSLLIVQEKERLGKLRSFFSEEEWGRVEEAFARKDLLLDARYLSEEMGVADESIEEVEAEEEQEVEEEAQAEEEEELATEQELETSCALAIDISKPHRSARTRPAIHSDHRFDGAGFFSNVQTSPLKKLTGRDSVRFWHFDSIFHNFCIHIFGIPQLQNPSLGGAWEKFYLACDPRENHSSHPDYSRTLWIENLKKRSQQLAPSAMIVVQKQGPAELECFVMGTVKEVDAIFEQVVNTDTHQVLHYRFFDQRDLTRDILTQFSPGARGEILRHIVLGKLLYAINMEWSLSEKQIFPEVWRDLVAHPVYGRNNLKKLLKQYIKTYSIPGDRGTLDLLDSV